MRNPRPKKKKGQCGKKKEGDIERYIEREKKREAEGQR